MKNKKLLTRILATAFALFVGYNAFAAHIIVAPSVTYIDGSTSPYNTLLPGDTLLFQGGARSYIQIRNFTGTLALPIIMMNTGGAVQCSGATSYGIKIANCNHVHFTGTGTTGIFYGFQVLSTNGDGCAEDELSSYIETDHVSLSNCGIRGIVAKTDPDCTLTSLRNNFTQYNTYIHDCYIYNTVNEGMYIGSSFYSGETITCNGKDTTVLPSLLIGVRIYNNTIIKTGWDGMQLGSAPTDCQIYNNLIEYDSQAEVSGQSDGILVGGGTRADVYNNYIYKGKGNGINSLGLGNYKIYNNVIYAAGTGCVGVPAYGIYQNDNSALAGSTISILFNNIINPLTYGIDFASSVTTNNLIASNVIINPGISGNYIEVSNPSNVSIQNNHEAVNTTGCGFIDTTYRINSTSCLIDAGYSDNRGITTDYWYNTRPYGAGFDIGICEYQGTGGSLPTVTTAAVTNITQTTATSGGNVTSDGGATVTARGVCWSTTTTPTTANSHTTDGSGTGSFTSSLTGLSMGTFYYVRAYATNSVGTAYGSQVTFTTLPCTPPTVTTAAVTNITQTTATSGGNVTSDGGATVTARGVCWSTATSPTTANSHTTDGSGTGTFTSSLTGLTMGTLYYVRAYATNSTGTAYGNQVTFTTLSCNAPTVTTAAVTNITQTTATGGGNVTSDGGGAVTTRGVCWSTTANPTTANNKTTDGSGTGTFTSSLTGLTANTLYYVRAYATNSAGTSYGSQVNFTTLPYPLPTVTTANVTNITQTSATSGGNVTSDGGTPVTARGVCWSTSSNPTLANSYTNDGSGTGTFISSLAGLTANTVYYVCAYATNITGTAYGNQVTFTTLPYLLPTVTTATATNITQTTATSGGNVTSDGGATVTVRGVCWSTSSNPTLANSYTTDGSGTGTFTSSLTGLTANTLYYVRAYATNSAGTSYGNQVTFTTLPYPLPTVTTANVTNITQTTATSGGNVTSDGGTPVTARGVCWSTSSSPTLANSHTTDGSGTGTFISSLAGLTANTVYYVCAYATNITGTAYGNQVTFTTLPYLLPTVTTATVTNITQTTATSGGNVTSDGGAAVTARGVCWSTSSNPTIANSYTTDGSGTGTFTSSLTGLSANTPYYVRAYATNSVGTSYGSQVTFTTLPYPLPTVTTANVTNITQTTATSGGKVTSDGGTPVTARGVCWSTSSSPTLATSHTTDGSGTGAFTSSLAGLTANTVYYVCAYATNITGTAYGNQVTFTTLTIVAPTVTTAPVINITQTTASSGGDVTSDGGAPVTVRGVCWNTSPNPTTANNKTTDGSGTGSYKSYLTGLTPNTLYYVRAYATNSVGTSYGNQLTFTTLPNLPTVRTGQVTDITQTTAMSGGKVLDDGGSYVKFRGVCWNTSPDPTTANNKTLDGSGTGRYASELTGLKPGTFYYVRAYATNSAGTAYGNQVTFKTASPALPDSITGEGNTNEITTGNTILLYPNPVYTTLNVSYTLDEAADFEIYVYDLKGVRFNTLNKHIEPGNQVISIDVSNLPDGFYVLMSRSDKNTFINKFIKVR